MCTLMNPSDRAVGIRFGSSLSQTGLHLKRRKKGSLGSINFLNSASCFSDSRACWDFVQRFSNFKGTNGQIWSQCTQITLGQNKLNYLCMLGCQSLIDLDICGN